MLELDSCGLQVLNVARATVSSGNRNDPAQAPARAVAQFLSFERPALSNQQETNIWLHIPSSFRSDLFKISNRKS